MIKLCINILLIISIVFSNFSQVYAATLSKKTLLDDISYYKKTSKQKNLSTNDRYYILLRIENKYKNSKVNLAPLKEEMKLLKAAPKEPKKAKSSSDKPKISEKTQIVDKISVNKSGSQIIISAKGVKKSNDFLLRDSDPTKPIKVVLDLYNAEEKLSDSDKNITMEKGIFSTVRASQFETTPNKIVRVVAEMRKEQPYTVENLKDGFVISTGRKTKKKDLKKEKTISPSLKQDAIPITEPKEHPSFSQQYKFEPGDVLAITVYPAEELSRQLVILPDGKLPFPLIGNLEARGLTPDQLEKSMTKKLSKYIADPTVSISIKKFSRRQVFITGQVRRAGAFPYKEDLRLMEFISSLGGFIKNANRKEIKVHRGPPDKRQVHTVNLDQIIESGDFSNDFLLEPGDIVEVDKSHDKVVILGALNGNYDYIEGYRLMELISKAGGIKNEAKISKVTITRTRNMENKPITKQVLKINLKNVLEGDEQDIELHSGDIIYIPKKSIARANWFVKDVAPWLSLLTLFYAARDGFNPE